MQRNTKGQQTAGSNASAGDPMQNDSEYCATPLWLPTVDSTEEPMVNSKLTCVLRWRMSVSPRHAHHYVWITTGLDCLLCATARAASSSPSPQDQLVLLGKCRNWGEGLGPLTGLSSYTTSGNSITCISWQRRNYMTACLVETCSCHLAYAETRARTFHSRGLHPDQNSSDTVMGGVSR